MTLISPPRRSDVLDATWLGFAYLALAFFPLALTRFDHGVSFIWVAASLLIARLSMLPFRRWPLPLAACAIGGSAAIATVGMGPVAAPFLVVIGLTESAIAAGIVRRFTGDDNCFDSMRGVGAFVLAAGVVAPLFSGLAGGAVATLVTGIPFRLNFIHWVASHAVGALTFTPIVMLALRGDFSVLTRQVRRREAAITAGLMALVALVVFGTFYQSQAPILFLPMLPMLAATIVRGRLGAAGSTIVLALVGGMLTFNGHGPITLLNGGTGARTLFFQLYVACATVLVLPVAALLKAQSSLLKRLRESEAKYRTLAERSGDAILDIAADGTIRYASPSIVDLTGIDPAALIGTSARALVDAKDIDVVWNSHLRAMEDRDAAYSAQYRGTGEARDKWFEASMRAVATDQGESIGVIGSVRDITDRKQNEFELTSAANTDPLTGLANRRAFMTLLQKRFQARDREVLGSSVALFDLDHFKTVNDRYGHAAGDEVLRAFAAVARGVMRAGDILSRIGGEEFAVLLANCTPEQAFSVCDRFREAIEHSVVHLHGDRDIAVTVSAGIARIDSYRDASAVLRAADAALYQAKDAGRNRLIAA